MQQEEGILTKVWKNSLISVRENSTLLVYMLIILIAGNAVFLNLETLNKNMVFPHLFAMYVFYYAFFRIYFSQKPFGGAENFVRSIAKAIVIFLLGFAMVVGAKAGFGILYYFAKSLAVFPPVYDFLWMVYDFFRNWEYTNIILVVLLFMASAFTFFIPCFAWLAGVLDKDGSIIFSLIETKKYYPAILTLYVLIYGMLPMFVASMILSGFVPAYFGIMISSVLTMIQVVIYAELYKILFPSSLFIK